MPDTISVNVRRADGSIVKRDVVLTPGQDLRVNANGDIVVNGDKVFTELDVTLADIANNTVAVTGPAWAVTTDDSVRFLPKGSVAPADNADFVETGIATPIASKEALYALTGLTGGERYETPDGAIWKYRGAGDSRTNSFEIIGDLGGMPEQALEGIYDVNTMLNGKPQYQGRSGILTDHIFYDGTHWTDLKRYLTASAGDEDYPWEANWIPFSGTLFTSMTERPEATPHNWINESANQIEVTTNYVKQLLTNLPVGVKVTVTEEAGRIEQFLGGDPIHTYFNISQAGNPSLYGSMKLHGHYVWNASLDRYATVESIGGGDQWVKHDGTKWVLSIGTPYFNSGFYSPDCPASTHPADVVGDWIPDGGAGTILNGAITKTPEADEENWQLIGNNTIDLTIDDVVGYMGPFDFNGVTVEGNVVNVGWVMVNTEIPCGTNSIYLRATKVNELPVVRDVLNGALIGSGGSVKAVIPDAFPKGATLTLDTWT